jgi:hypothetical protein
MYSNFEYVYITNVYLQFCNLHCPLMLLRQLYCCRKKLLMQSLFEEKNLFVQN